MNIRKLTRRDFLKSISALGVATAVANLSPKAPTPISSSVRTLDKTAAEIHQVKPEYKRFHYRHVAYWRGDIDPNSPAYQWRRKFGEYGLKWMKEGKPGYTLRDVALMNAMGTVDNASESSLSKWGFGNQGFFSWDPLVATPPHPDDRFEADPAEASKTVKKAAMALGADLVGICELDRRWVYLSNYEGRPDAGRPIVFEPVGKWYATEDKVVIPESHKYVVVMAVRMNRELFRYAPTRLMLGATIGGYNRIAGLSPAVAEFIRTLGYQAIPCANDTAMSIPLAIDAGLGQQGRMGRIITPEYGSLVRLCKVITDLPLKPDKPIDFGVTEFCSVCTKCARSCPSQAISYGGRTWSGPSPSNNPGILKWYLDADKCCKMWGEFAAPCGICHAVCPFNKGDLWVHDVTKSVINNARPLDPLLVWTDDALGYGRLKDPEEFWK